MPSSILRHGARACLSSQSRLLQPLPALSAPIRSLTPTASEAFSPPATSRVSIATFPSCQLLHSATDRALATAAHRLRPTRRLRNCVAISATPLDTPRRAALPQSPYFLCQQTPRRPIVPSSSPTLKQPEDASFSLPRSYPSAPRCTSFSESDRRVARRLALEPHNSSSSCKRRDTRRAHSAIM
jgi:hypothetical protein